MTKLHAKHIMCSITAQSFPFSFPLKTKKALTAFLHYLDKESTNNMHLL